MKPHSDTATSSWDSRSIVVGISDCRVSNDPTAVLVTHALGSCIAVIVHDPICSVGGMIRYMLPLSRTSPEEARLKPAMFGDTGIPLLFECMGEQGCRKQDLVVKVAGGGRLYENNGTFDIGRRNYTVLRRFLWRNNILIAAEDVGGARSRTVRLHVGSGLAVIRSQGKELVL